MMSFRRLFFYSGLLLLVSACNNGTNTTNSSFVPGPAPTADTVKSKPYTITETFENGTKGSYAEGNIDLSTGSWDFNGAVIGDLPKDVKNGSHAARLRNGYIAMNFDMTGVTSISIKHAKYGMEDDAVWQLLISTDGGTTYTQLGNDINESNTTLVTDSFAVSTTQKVRFEIKNTGASRINIDDFSIKGIGYPGISISQIAADTSSVSNSSSSSRGVIIGNDAPPEVGDNSDLLFGNPSGASTSTAVMDNYLIDQGYYTESYNATKGEPNWVSWHLDAANTTNVSKRQNDFAGFNGLPAGWFEVKKASYNGSGFDRGHNCPSADRSSSANANDATFLMTNMIPQAPENNEHTWANLENYLREQVAAGNEVYIIMGSYGMGGVGSKGAANTIDKGKITVPSNIWKVALIIPVGDNDLVRVDKNTRVIAVNTPNINSIDPDWKKYIVTIRAIEDATGYTLLSALPEDARSSLETEQDTGLH